MAIMNQILGTLMRRIQAVECERGEAVGFETSRLPPLGGAADMREGSIHLRVEYHYQKESLSIEMIQICHQGKVIGFARAPRVEI